MTNWNGTSYEEIKAEVKHYLENPPMIALPGGTWCHLCGEEICRDMKHMNRQMLMIVVNKLIRDLSEERK